MPTLDEMRGVGPDEMAARREEMDNQQDAQQQAPEEETQQNQESTDQLQQEARKAFSEDQDSSEGTSQTGDEPSSGPEDADEERQRNIRTLENSFGASLDELPEQFRDTALKMAKSYREAQSKFTQATQERSELAEKKQEYEQAWQNMEGFLSSNPDIERQIRQRMENPNASTKEPQGQPKSASEGQLTEQQLIDAGYLNTDNLQGMDELARRRAVEQARIDHYNDQKVDQYRQSVEQIDQERQQQRQQQRIQQENKNRMDDGIDRFVADFGVNLSNLDQDTINAVNRRAKRILDPQDEQGRLIDEDAYYDALRKELSMRGKLPQPQQQPQQANMNELENTGASINKRQQDSSVNSLSDYLEKREKEQASKHRTTHPRLTGENN